MLGKRLRPDARVQDPSDLIYGRKSGWGNMPWLGSAAPQRRDAFLTLYRTFGLCVEAKFEFWVLLLDAAFLQLQNEPSFGF